MNKITIISIVVLLIHSNIFSQNINRYAVHFSDKKNTIFSIKKPKEFLSEKAINRKGRTITPEDFPVNPRYITSIKNLGAKVIGTSRWMNIALVVLDKSKVESLKALPYVDSVEFIAPNAQPAPRSFTTNSDRKLNQHNAKASLPQHKMLGIPHMHEDGYYGQNILIAILDAGYINVQKINYFDHIFINNKIIDTKNFITNGSNVYRFHSHGTSVLSTISAYGEKYLGVAPEALLAIYLTEDVRFEYRIEEYNWLLAAERADSIGADIITSSLGYYVFDDPKMNYKHSHLNGNTAIITKAANKAFERGIIVVSSAGNEGNKKWKKITPPSDGKHILAIGSVNTRQKKSSFSSIGPIAAPWIKPDLMAMGQQTTVINENGEISKLPGTSFSAPQVTGLIAGLWQKYPNLTNEQLINSLKMSASLASKPNSLLGYGIPNYTAFSKYYKHTKIKPNKYNKLTIYPNPNNGFIRILMNNLINVEKIDVTITSLSGKQVFTKSILPNWQHNPFQININYLAKGTYILRISTPQHSEIHRIIKL